METLDDFYPPYILPESPWLEQWESRNPHGWKRPSPSAPRQDATGREPHIAAAQGDLERLEEIAQKNKALLKRSDENGWHPVHEAARAGHKDVVELLIKHGADKNARTRGSLGRNRGFSPLNLALSYHPVDSPVVQYLMSIGAENIAPDEL